ncbi:hypothetical protein Ndes2526B_g09333 [Nannochloris sp. 'desiccata']|nr:hypothetical protein KSW81_003639 [Chlorella desiccata (nom. nud.)]KAH7616020.1 hypothetical protein NADE_000855 [Chlorella desiccata (nom. nud.)]
MRAHAILCVLLALALGAPTANTMTTFTADLKPVGGLSVPGSGSVLIVADDAVITWQVNVTDVVGLSQLQIVDGMGDGSVEGVTLMTLDPPVTAESENLSGSFDASAVNPAVASNLGELAGHICMGHIYAAAKMEDGQMLMGKLRYMPEEGSALTCEEAVPGDHSSGHSAADATPSSSAIALNAASRSIVGTVMAVVVFVFLS